MPEYRYPGVYVEEVGTGARPIGGVGTTTAGRVLDPRAFESLAADFRRAVTVHAPEWTGRNESDPGVTLVQVFAFLAENLLYRAGHIPERARTALGQVAAALAALAPAGESAGGPLERPRYFTGRILDAATLTAEQDYFREKLRRHNRALVGWGVVSGLGVHVAGDAQAGGLRIVVEPGYAVDAYGEEISLPRAVALAPPGQGDAAFVTICSWENPCLSVPAPEGETSEARCVEEACVVGIRTDPGAQAIALARIVLTEGSWRVDPAFLARRVPFSR
jgi:hypothetical protein